MVIKKNITYYSTKLSNDDLIKINDISKNYNLIKNYFYSRYSGIKSYLKIQNHRKIIRDNLVLEKFKCKIPSRYWKLALDEVASNIKSNWANTIKNIKLSINNNKNLNDDEKHYIYYILKSKQLLFDILNKNSHITPIKFKDLDINKLNKYICSIVRKYKNNIPKTKSKYFSIDPDMYSIKNNILTFQTIEKGKRLSILLNTNFKFNKTLKVKVENEKLKINHVININSNENTGNNVIGIDKNYENVIATSTGNIYGDGINKKYNKYTDYISIKYKNRNKIVNILNKNKDKGNFNKINNIINHNLGNKNITKRKHKLKENIKSIINNSLNTFIINENPKELIVENLKFQSKNKKLNKKSKHKLNSWSKGYVQDRIEYKSKINNIKITEVNAAFTSQQCPECLWFYDNRSTNIVYCDHCGRGLNVHIDSANIILKRSLDKEITLYMHSRQIKSLLYDRNKTLMELKTESTSTLDTF